MYTIDLLELAGANPYPVSSYISLDTATPKNVVGLDVRAADPHELLARIVAANASGETAMLTYTDSFKQKYSYPILTGRVLPFAPDDPREMLVLRVLVDVL